MSELKTIEECLAWLVKNLPERFTRIGPYHAEAALREWLTEKHVIWEVGSRPSGLFLAWVAHDTGLGVNTLSEISPFIALTNAVRRAMEEGLIR